MPSRNSTNVISLPSRCAARPRRDYSGSLFASWCNQTCLLSALSGSKTSVKKKRYINIALGSFTIFVVKMGKQRKNRIQGFPFRHKYRVGFSSRPWRRITNGYSKARLSALEQCKDTPSMIKNIFVMYFPSLLSHMNQCHSMLPSRKDDFDSQFHYLRYRNRNFNLRVCLHLNIIRSTRR